MENLAFSFLMYVNGTSNCWKFNLIIINNSNDYPLHWNLLIAIFIKKISLFSWAALIIYLLYFAILIFINFIFWQNYLIMYCFFYIFDWVFHKDTPSKSLYLNDFWIVPYNSHTWSNFFMKINNPREIKTFLLIYSFSLFRNSRCTRNKNCMAFDFFLLFCQFKSLWRVCEKMCWWKCLSYALLLHITQITFFRFSRKQKAIIWTNSYLYKRIRIKVCP